MERKKGRSIFPFNSGGFDWFADGGEAETFEWSGEAAYRHDSAFIPSVMVNWPKCRLLLSYRLHLTLRLGLFRDLIQFQFSFLAAPSRTNFAFSRLKNGTILTKHPFDRSWDDRCKIFWNRLDQVKSLSANQRNTSPLSAPSSVHGFGQRLRPNGWSHQVGSKRNLIEDKISYRLMSLQFNFDWN